MILHIRKLIFVLLGLGFASLLGSRPVVAADVAHPLSATSWIGWQQTDPTPVYLFKADERPRNLGTVWRAPAAYAVSGWTVLLVGRDFAATGPVGGQRPVENANLPGEWSHALGNAAGFVITDGRRVRFSPDGKTWREAGDFVIGENMRVLEARASEKEFMFLLDVATQADGATYHYARVVRSTDGVKWEEVFESEPQTGSEPEVTMLAHAKGRWTAMGVGSRYDSVDGRKWEPQDTGRKGLPRLRDGALHFGGGEWWAIDWHGKFQFSPDGRDWSAEPEELKKLSNWFWAVGESGMRNIALDVSGVVRVRTLADVRADRHGAPAAPAAGGPVRIIDMKAFGKSVSPVVVAQGRYALSSGDGMVRFSTDARHWDAVKLDAPAPLAFVRHDGERWLAATKNGQLSTSTDGKKWSAFFPTPAARPEAVQWRGRYWSSLTIILGVSNYDYKLGRYDRGRDEPGREWDHQLQNPRRPALFWRQGGCLRTILREGHHYVSDNGEYWAVTGGVHAQDTRKVFAAEGNGRVVVVVVMKAAGVAPLVTVQDGKESPKRVETVFTQVTGLAYGLGRFVALAGTKADPKPAFYESADGHVWTQVGASRRDLKDVVFGPAGFVATAGADMLAVYQPEPWAEKPMPSLEPVAVPHFQLKDFGSNFVGVGKKRRRVAMTPNQEKVEKLKPLAQSAYAGDVPAGVRMGLLMLEGSFVESNPWRAEIAFKAGIAAKVPEAGRGYAELLGRWKPETPRAELENLQRQSAELGDTAAMAWLALNLEPGTDSRRAEIEKWRAGAAAADSRFETKWKERENYRANIAKAEAGDPVAIMVVAPLLLFGEGVTQDHAKAKALLQHAVEQGDEKATLYLIELYEAVYTSLTPVPKLIDAKEYVRLLTKLSDAGNKAATTRLVGALLTGRGVARDEQKAHDLAMALALKGDADGMALVAGVLMESKGALRNEAKGREWVEKAAAAGHVAAKQWLEQQAKAAPAGK